MPRYTSLPLLFVAAFTISHLALAKSAESFSLQTYDHKTFIAGEIDFPDNGKDCQNCQFPLIVMIPGTGLYDRDYLFGISGTDRDFMFRDFAEALAEVGIASLRYDYRGVGCNPRTAPPCPDCSPEERNRHYIASCIDNDVRSAVTMENMDEDVELIYTHALQHKRIDPNRIVVLAHSEGTIHVSRLISVGRVVPRALLYLGMVAESPAGVMRWQETDRFLRVFSWDTDHDGVLSNDEIRTGFSSDPYFSSIGLTVDALLSPSGSWTEKTFRSSRVVSYDQLRSETLAHRDDEPIVIVPEPLMVQAAYAWSKAFFTDERPIVDLLRGYPGRLIAHNGGYDSQTPAERELGVLSVAAGQFQIAPIGIHHPDVGHGFSPDSPLLGPVVPYIRDAILRDLKMLVGPGDGR